LERVNCSTVLVTRLSVILESTFTRFTPDWDLTVLPAIPLCTYERNRIEEAWTLLSTVVSKRAGEGAFYPDARRIIIQASGGLFRELVSLARHACLLAERSNNNRVSTMEAIEAMQHQRLNHTATLSPADRDVLRQFSRPDRDRTIADQGIFEQVN